MGFLYVHMAMSVFMGVSVMMWMATIHNLPEEAVEQREIEHPSGLQETSSDEYFVQLEEFANGGISISAILERQRRMEKDSRENKEPLPASPAGTTEEEDTYPLPFCYNLLLLVAVLGTLIGLPVLISDDVNTDTDYGAYSDIFADLNESMEIYVSNYFPEKEESFNCHFLTRPGSAHPHPNYMQYEMLDDLSAFNCIPPLDHTAEPFNAMDGQGRGNSATAEGMEEDDIIVTEEDLHAALDLLNSFDSLIGLDSSLFNYDIFDSYDFDTYTDRLMPSELGDSFIDEDNFVLDMYFCILNILSLLMAVFFVTMIRFLYHT